MLKSRMSAQYLSEISKTTWGKIHISQKKIAALHMIIKKTKHQDICIDLRKSD